MWEDRVERTLHQYITHLYDDHRGLSSLAGLGRLFLGLQQLKWYKEFVRVIVALLSHDLWQLVS